MSASQTWGRSTWPLLLLCLALLPSSGCLNFGKSAVTADAPPASSQATELPTDAAARACLTVAASMEREGHEREAITEYERARQRDPNIKVSRQLAVLYDKVGQQQLAL